MGVPQGLRLTPASTNMQKTKSPSSSKSRHIIQSWWKGKSAPSSPCSGKGFWSPEADNTWCNMKNKIVLSPTSLLHLTEVERIALQKVALSRLQAMNLGVPITIPKDGMNNKTKKSRFLLKRRTVSSNVIDTLNPNDPRTRNSPSKAITESKTSGWVFGIPLAKCIANDIELRRMGRTNHGATESNAYDMTHSPLRNRKSSSSSGGALSNDESLSEMDCSRTQGSNLVDALLLPVSSRLDTNRMRAAQVSQQHKQQLMLQAMPVESTLRVPYVVDVCCRHLQAHGLGVLGIFRIGSSKKRTIQLRDEFDTGQEMHLTEEHNPHDVGAVLKEFFRDLPDPLLTRSLYSAFVATRKFKDNQHRLRSVNLLIALLPPCNRDTLWALLSFLNLIAKHSTDFVDDQGNKVAGNKMDAHNLATLFGPNILHKAKGGAFQVESLERAEERAEVISVVKEMIEHQADIFELSAEMHDETLRDLLKTNPEDVDYILQCRTINFNVEADRESSSSVCEESDSSSMPPHSPGYCSETDAIQPRSFVDVFQASYSGSGHSSTTTQSRTLIEFLQSHASSTPSLPSIAIGIACPHGSSPLASAGPAGPDRTSTERKKPHPNMRIEITTDEDDYQDGGPRTGPLLHESSRASSNLRRASGLQQGTKADVSSNRRSMAAGSNRQTLMVPTAYSGKDLGSSSTGPSSPRHSPFSSRSLSSSSPSPEPTWIQCPGSPSLTLAACHGTSTPTSLGSPASVHRNWSSSSSSKHRPLGLSSCSQHCSNAASSVFCSHRRPDTSSTEISPDWHETRWTDWSRINQQKGEELQEQETLV